MGVLVNGIMRYGSWQKCSEKTRKKAFRVADSEAGIMAVAKALNFGWSDIQADDAEAEKYTKYGISFKGRDQKMHCSQPVIMTAKETMGYREISDNLCLCYAETIVTFDDWDEEQQCGNTWAVDVYRLRPGMSNGWILIQSSSSRATIKAEKRESAWLVTLDMPLIDEERCIGHSYEARFASAKAWYREQLRNN